MTVAKPEMTTIEKKILIRAPRSRVWNALTTPEHFSKWFSAKFDGPFLPGRRVDMVSTHPASSGDAKFCLTVERMEPEHTFSWSWHPGSANKQDDGTTLVEFHLDEAPEGTLVTVKESGFDRVSLARRARAFEENTRGWDIQLESLSRYASEAA
ncbi:MAG: SRPBCC family protein [Acidobacteriaceae bacterium]|nr:SRPBCC family protein [Acidobacteriaceae bacterium]